MTLSPLTFASLRQALAEGWHIASATRRISFVYALIFTLGGLLIIGSLLALGWTPFIIAAAGGFMLVGPITMAGFFGIAGALDGGQPVGPGSIASGFVRASPALWALALVCGLLFMIFMTDAAILYAYVVGVTPVWLDNLLPANSNVLAFVRWAGISGFVLALLLYAIAAFSTPLLCERRAGLVEAVATSVRIVFANFAPAIVWAFLLSTVVIGSILLLPLLPLTLPWLAYASRALYRQALPVA
ncbi:DUF2189 domain-containing protein [Dechloromonas sp. HYN0024]|uniref:DUF2189 domain-containing protein n=1 Tax=Dechloromonas sp. HYN0024 TaxID=2231055 RepID=UPI000E440690|nr:DUF2189 domain-containing protein [Dechloromonas sp. HYN0024]AXS79655.1 DUF2189 domain-containing protein [Dechloromonas sp. HYN0024]